MRMVFGRNFSIVCVVACALLLFAGGCGGGSSSRGAAVNPVDQAPGAAKEVAGALSGTVKDQNGNPVAMAYVTVEGAPGTSVTDENGVFTAPISSVSASGVQMKLKLTHGGYYTTYKTIYVYDNTLIEGVMAVDFVMIRQPDTIEDATRAQITSADGTTRSILPEFTTDPESGLSVVTTTVEVSPDDRAVSFNTPSGGDTMPDVTLTIGDPTGGGANATAVLGGAGQITGSIVYGDPTDPIAMKFFPGDLTINTPDGEKALVTAGFTRITLKDESGNPITSFPGGQINITMRVPYGIENPMTGAEVKAGDTVPILVFNETTGEWVNDPAAGGAERTTTILQDLEGLYVNFPMSHLTTINLDWQSTLCPRGVPSASVFDADGNPLNGATIVSSTPSGYTSNHVYTITDSQFDFYMAPANATLTVWAYKGVHRSDPVEVRDCKDASTGLSIIRLVLDKGFAPPQCQYDYDCADGDLLTRDYCNRTLSSANLVAACRNLPCVASCNRDADCVDSDNDVWTTAKCWSPGTCDAMCYLSSASCLTNSNCNDNDSRTTDSCVPTYTGSRNKKCVSFVPVCKKNLDCDDGNANSVDTCIEPGKQTAKCHSFTPRCKTKADCDDGNADTVDLCDYPSKENSSCRHPRCVTSKDCDDKDVNTLDTCYYPNNAWSSCRSCKVNCKNSAACNDGNANTIDTCNSPGTCNSRCTSCSSRCSTNADCGAPSPNEIRTCKSPKTCSSWCSSCWPGCKVTADCDDNNSNTTDKCVGAGTCSAHCTNVPKPACVKNADCNDNNTLTSDYCMWPNTIWAGCWNSCSSACYSDYYCDDGNSQTTDICNNPGTCAASCEHNAISSCDIACSSDSECNDNNSQTTDACNSPGACESACEHNVISTCSPACSANSQCDDGNSLTTDACNNPGTCSAACSNTMCLIACSSNAQCNDGNATTTDTCSNPGGCSASCSHAACPVACLSDSQCNDNNSVTIDTCANPGTCSASCAHTSCIVACVSSAQCNDNNPITNDACNNPGTCAASCSHGVCPIACSSSAQCNDNNSLTTDACNNAGTCSATCSHTQCPVACLSDSQCDDNNSLTIDSCGNPGTCSASCSHVPCPIACSSSAQCNDNNSLTIDSCVNPGTCASSCSRVPCSVACSSSAQCDDNNSLTIDTCAGAGTCSASCSNVPCEIACSSDAQCDDSNSLTTDACLNPETCSAACSNRDITPPSVIMLSPADGATNVPYEQTAFKMVFSEPMDASINLNDQGTLNNSNFSIEIRHVLSGVTLTVTKSNALSFGSFSWQTTTTANDTLVFTLKSGAALTAANLPKLYPATAYSVLSRPVPPILKDVAGNPVNALSIPETGTFTTRIAQN